MDGGTGTVSYSYQWKRGGIAISGATSSSYLLVTADLAAMISCTVTATNVAGSANATAAAVGPVTAAAANSITASAGAFALSGKSATLTFTPAAGGYTGPGEVAGWGTAYAYWGLRAYNTAKIGQPCLDVCSNGSGAPANLITVNAGSNGYADFSAVGYSPIYVTKLYDQSGSQHLFFNNAFWRPEITASMVGGKPAMKFDGSCWGMTSGNATALAQIVNVAAVVRADTYTSNRRILTDGTVNFQPMSIPAAAQVGQYLGVFADNHASVADNTFGSLISVCANSAGGIYINGVNAPATGNVGPNGIGSTNKLTMGATDDGGSAFTGYIYEIMIKGGSISATNIGLLNTNHHQIGSGWT
jgi:hypothetical protein